MAGRFPEPLDLKRFYILLAVSAEPLHGLGVHQRVLELSQSTLYFHYGSLYRILADLVKRGYIEELQPEDATKRYKLTAFGYRIARSQAIILRDVTMAAIRRLP
jgi:DNA-binding PadR family transcriptional regulator